MWICNTKILVNKAISLPNLTGSNEENVDCTCWLQTCSYAAWVGLTGFGFIVALIWMSYNTK
ncbi:hypothetical protein Vi05172_g12024 [Venturia inaequalis]|nr:hypothetical protein Vi05172_g12024 [Venturia inaequalis]